MQPIGTSHHLVFEALGDTKLFFFATTTILLRATGRTSKSLLFLHFKYNKKASNLHCAPQPTSAAGLAFDPVVAAAKPIKQG
jgi:hypothetical protein